MVGQHNLAENVYLVACGNGENDGAIAGKLGTALKSRVITVNVEVQHDAWMNWAAAKGIHQYIMDYLSWKPNLLHEFDPNTDDLSFPCPRTWEMLSDIINARGSYDDVSHQLALGTIGKIASEFKSFIAHYAKLPSIKAILKDPANADMPTEIGAQYALTGVLSNAMADNADDKNAIKDLMVYAERMGAEMQVVTVSNSLRKERKLLINQDIDNWVTKNRPLLSASL